MIKKIFSTLHSSLLILNSSMYPKIVAITFVLLFACTPAHAGSPADPPPLVKQHGCDGCHRFSADTGPERKKAPDLFYAGDKFQETWLKEYLSKPVVIRKAGYITDPGFLLGKPVAAQTHVSLSREDANVMADYLLSLKMPGLAAGVVDKEVLSKEEKTKAKILFERNFGCSSCHESITLAKKVRGGISGPSLVDAGNRLQADWTFHRLTNPGKLEPKGRMPIFNLQEEEAISITKYLMTLKKENLRQGRRHGGQK